MVAGYRFRIAVSLFCCSLLIVSGAAQVAPPKTQLTTNAPLVGFTFHNGSWLLTSNSDQFTPGPGLNLADQLALAHRAADTTKLETQNQLLLGRLSNLQCQVQQLQQASKNPTPWTALATDAGVLGLSYKGLRAGAVNGATVEEITSELLKLRVPLETAEKYAPEILKALRSPVATGIFVLGIGLGGYAVLSKLHSEASKPEPPQTASGNCAAGLQFPVARPH